MPVLEVLTGDLQGRSFPIEDRVFSIGRLSDNDLVLPKKYFARKHAEILRRGHAYIVRGLSDKNPIFADNRETAELELRDGETFEICDVRFRFHARDAQKPQVKGASASRERHRFDSDGARSGAGGGGLVGLDPNDDDSGFFDSEEEDDTSELAGARAAVAARKPSAFEGLDSFEDAGAPAPSPRASLPPEPSDSDAPPPQRIVFGAEEADSFDDDEKTGVVPVAPVDDEQTGAIDLLDLDVEKEDPFANTVEQKQQEKVVKVASYVGLVAIVIAGLMVLFGGEKAKPQHFKALAPINVGIGQTIVREVDFKFNDPPIGFFTSGELVEGVFNGPFTPRKYERWQPVIVNDSVHVYWVLPTYRKSAIFVVTGLAPGQYTFVLKYAEKKDTKEFQVIVDGDGPELRKHKALLAELAVKSVDELKARIESQLRRGDELWRERFSKDRYGYWRRSIEFFENAQDCVDVLKKKIGDIDSEFFKLKDRVKQKLDSARDEYNSHFEKQKSLFDEYAKKGDRQAAKLQLEKMLGLLHDEQSEQYMLHDQFRQAFYAE